MKTQIKDNLKVLGIILVLTFLVSIPYLNFEVVSTHDISYHSNRIISISQELQAGHFPVLIYSNMLDGFGYASSLFYPELFLYIPAILTALGMHFLTSFKLLTIISTFFTFLFTFYSANRIFKNKNISWVITILYGCAFYRLTNIYTRGAIGEILVLTFLPLVICGLYEIIFGENKKWWILCFGIFGIMNSHILSFVITVVFILIVCLINIVRIFKDKKRLVNLIIAGVISILLICSFVLPYLEQANSDTFKVDKNGSVYTGEFLEYYAVSLKELINNEFNKGEYYKGIGTILLILPFFIFKCKNKDNENTFMKQLFALGLVFLIITTTLFPWKEVCEKFEFIRTFQFPFRLNILITVMFSFVGGYAICNILENKKELLYIIYIFLIMITLSLLSSLNTNFLNLTLEEILTYSPVGNAEYEPYELSKEDKKVHNVANEEEIKFTRNSSKIEFNYENTEDEMTIHIPLAYYKGYVAYIEDDGVKTELTVSKDEKTKNVIVSNDEILTGKITVEYKMTAIQRIGYILTYVTLLGLVVYIIYNYIKGLKTKRNAN